MCRFWIHHRSKVSVLESRQCLGYQFCYKNRGHKRGTIISSSKMASWNVRHQCCWMAVIALPWRNDVPDFLTTIIASMWKDSHHGGAIGLNDVFIWQIFGFLSLTTLQRAPSKKKNTAAHWTSWYHVVCVERG